MLTKKKILAVDDNMSNLAIIEELLDDQYDLMMVSTGQDALTAAREFEPDLILLDIMMPDIDGYEVCKRLRMTPSLRYTRILVVSVKAMVAERLKGYQAGADDYITKPFDGDELLAKVRVYLRLESAKEIDQIQNDALGTLCDKTALPLNSLIRQASSLVSDGQLDSRQQRQLAEQIYQSAKELQGCFEDMIPRAIRMRNVQTLP